MAFEWNAGADFSSVSGDFKALGAFFCPLSQIRTLSRDFQMERLSFYFNNLRWILQSRDQH
ncbi:MAG: hypothetical protein WAV18_18485, partial [Roseiarcus sp.]